MDRYRTRPGIVMTKICGSYVLIPSRTAMDYCKLLQPISFLGALIYAGLEKEKPQDEIVKVCQILGKKTEETAKEQVEYFCRDMVKKGFLIKLSEKEKEKATATEDE